MIWFKTSGNLSRDFKKTEFNTYGTIVVREDDKEDAKFYDFTLSKNCKPVGNQGDLVAVEGYVNQYFSPKKQQTITELVVYKMEMRHKKLIVKRSEQVLEGQQEQEAETTGKSTHWLDGML